MSEEQRGPWVILKRDPGGWSFHCRRSTWVEAEQAAAELRAAGYRARIVHRVWGH
jgi:hypothetical protein